MLFDACCFTGKWPFRKLGRPEISQMLEDHGRNGVTGGIVSSLESVFYNDPNEGDEDVAWRLPAGYLFAATHNPMLPYAAKEISENAYNAAAVRLFPCYHMYKPDDPRVAECCRAAASAGLVVYVIARMDDMRFDYILHQQVTDIASIAVLARTVPEARFVVSYGLELYNKIHLFADLPNVYIDGAYMPDLVFGYRDVAPGIPPGRLLFGTHHPLQLMESNVVTLRLADMETGEKDCVMYKNAAELFGLPVALSSSRA